MHKLIAVVSALVVLAGCVGETSPPPEQDDRADEQAEQAQDPKPAPVAAPTTDNTVKPLLKTRH